MGKMVRPDGTWTWLHFLNFHSGPSRYKRAWRGLDSFITSGPQLVGSARSTASTAHKATTIFKWDHNFTLELNTFCIIIFIISSQFHSPK